VGIDAVVMSKRSH